MHSGRQPQDGYERAPVGVVAILCLCSSVTRVIADSITVTLAHNEVLQCEPVVLNVGLQLDEPLRDAGDPASQIAQDARLRRKLRGRLQRDGADVCSFPLLGGEFIACDQSRQRFQATFVTMITYRPVPKERQHRYWDEPGHYSLVVSDVEHDLNSGNARLTIAGASGSAADAKRLFQVGEAQVAAMQMILEHRGDTETIGAFERLAELYPETPYGKYAQVCLSLRTWEQTSETHGSKGGDAVWNPVASKLIASARLLDVGNPLRQEAMLQGARAQGYAGAYGQARDTLNALREQAPLSKYAPIATQAIEELSRLAP